MLKAYFNKETLQEIHQSLNNIDKLHYLVGKTYKIFILLVRIF